MATKTLKKFQEGYGKFVSLTGKILKLNTYVFSTVWNNAWLIDIKYPHFKAFIRRIERFLCKYKGNILQKVSTSRDQGGLGLINIKERIQAIQVLNTSTQTYIHRKYIMCYLKYCCIKKTLYEKIFFVLFIFIF